MTQFTLVGNFVLIQCGECGVPFGMSEAFQQARRRDHAAWYCPNGHQRHYPGKSDMEALRDQVARQKQSAEFWQRRSEENARAAVSANHRLRATKGVVTKIKRRVSKGVCPCCNRTFRDLARHMEGQHPEFAKEGTRA